MTLLSPVQHFSCFSERFIIKTFHALTHNSPPQQWSSFVNEDQRTTNNMQLNDACTDNFHIYVYLITTYLSYTRAMIISQQHRTF